MSARDGSNESPLPLVCADKLPETDYSFSFARAEPGRRAIGGRSGVPSFWLIGLQAAAAWSPPAQAAWRGDHPSVEIQLQAGEVSMHAIASIQVDLVARAKGFAVSPFLQASRGIAFEVTAATGEPEQPLEPMLSSPPPPPLPTEKLVAVTAASPFRVMTREQARTIFPGPGTYRVRAILFLFDSSSDPVRRAQVASEPIMVHVTE